MTRLAAPALLLVVAAAAQDYRPWRDARFREARIRPVAAEEIAPPGSPEISALVPLTLVLYDKTNWTEARALRHIRKTAAILAPCGVGLGPVSIARVQAPNGEHDVDMGDLYPGSNIPRQVFEASMLVPAAAPRPRVFFVGRLLHDSAIARSYRPSDESVNTDAFPYFHTAWIAYQAHWKERAEEEYSSLAHELAHILCRCGHSAGDQRHLLNEKRNFLGPEILVEDCARIRSSPLLKQLDAARR